MVHVSEPRVWGGPGARPAWRWRVVFCLLLGAVAVVARAGIPDPKIYRWGKIEVPENYDQPDGRKLQIYWEKLTSTNPQPKALVLINGGPGSTHESFHKFNAQGGFEKDYFHALRDEFEIYLFDQRGNGQSSRLSFKTCSQVDLKQYGTVNICRDIEELRRRVIRQPKIAVLGESYGGMVALSYAVYFPGSVSRLVLHDTSPSFRYFTHLYQNFSNSLANLDAKEFPGIRKNFRMALRRLGEGSVSLPAGVVLTPNDFLSKCLVFTYSFRGLTILARMVGEMAADGRSKVLNSILDVDRRQQADGAESGPSPTLLSVQAMEMLHEPTVAELEGVPAYDPWNLPWAKEKMFPLRRAFRQDAGLDGFAPYDLTGRLGEVTAPTLVIVGSCDFVCPPVYARQMQKGIGNGCRLLVVDQAAHGAFAEKQDYTVGAIKAFLLPDRQFADVCPPARVDGPAAQKILRHSDVLDSYIEGTRRLRGILGGN